MNKRAATWKQYNNWNFFHQKMSHIISLKVTKFQQPLLITLGVTDEKPEGVKKPPPPPAKDRVKVLTNNLVLEICESRSKTGHWFWWIAMYHTSAYMHFFAVSFKLISLECVEQKKLQYLTVFL